jgi:hypothetical protein
MARNEKSFDVGNRVGSKLTPELHEQFVSIVAQTGRISIASGRCGLGTSTAKHWMARGRQEESGPYREFLDAVERARSDFLLFANRNLNRLATGGLIRLPSFDKSGSPIRNHKKTCGAAPGYPCDCDLVYVEKVLMPNPNVLMWQVDRLDPLPNGDPAPEVPERPMLSEEERLAEAVAVTQLYREALRIAVAMEMPIGVPLDQARAFLESAIDVTPANQPAKESDPPPTTSAVTIATTIETATPAEPSDKPPEAF